MKATFTSGRSVVMALMCVLLVFLGNIAKAQLPDCTSGNIVYAIFNRDTVSTFSDSTEIRPVNVTTGAVGALMGGHRYYIRKFRSGTTWYYGSSGLAVDMITNRFYVITQMSSALAKDIITIDPVLGTQMVIGTTPATLDQHHFVKLAVSPTGIGYGIGVARDSVSTTIANYNPLMMFTPCNSTATCANPTLLGYLSSAGNLRGPKLFNGDITFDIAGNLYFLTVAFDNVAGTPKYTDARLFKIDAANIPAVGGTGIIPVTFVADYNAMDTTVVNGIAFNNAGNMMLATRRFASNTTNPNGPYTSELYRSSVAGSATLVAGFGPITAKFQIADLAACYFPTTILGLDKLQLQYKYENGNVKLKWEMISSSTPTSFEVQRSNDGVDFETIATITPIEKQTTYTYSDPQSGFDRNKFYRIRATMNANLRNYTNVVNVNFNSKVSLLGNIKPNPFNSQLEVNLWLKSVNPVNVRILDQSGRVVYNHQFAGRTGDNQLKMDNLGKLKPAVYVVEMRVQDEVLREKVIKQ